MAPTRLVARAVRVARWALDAEVSAAAAPAAAQALTVVGEGPCQTEAALWALLEPAEQARLARHRHRVDLLRGLAGALLVRTLLAEAYAGLLPPVGGFAVPRYAATGRPGLPSAIAARGAGAGGRATFSVSHQGAYTVVGGHPARPVGVDVMDCVYPPTGVSTDAFLAPLQEQVRPRPSRATRTTLATCSNHKGRAAECVRVGRGA